MVRVSKELVPQISMFELPRLENCIQISMFELPRLENCIQISMFELPRLENCISRLCPSPLGSPPPPTAPHPQHPNRVKTT